MFPIKNNCNCNSKNLVYLITCKICGIQYVGETGGPLRERLNNHRSDVKTKKQTPIGIHFNSENHSFGDLEITVIDLLDTEKIYARRDAEYSWQLKLGTIYPQGLNGLPLDKLDKHHFRKNNPFIPTRFNRPISCPADVPDASDLHVDPPAFNDVQKILTVNLSKFVPSKADIDLLERGLTFIPTPKLLPVKNVIDNSNRLIRSLKLKHHFRDDDNAFDPKAKTFVNKSTWAPRDKMLSPAVRELISEISDFTDNIVKNSKTKTINDTNFILLKEKFNLTREEFSSIKNLKSRSDIVIKPADKGGATVILDRENYIAEAMRQLNNKNYYKKLDGPIFVDNKPKIANILQDMLSKNFLSHEQYLYLSGPDNFRNRTFYLLPKIHKKPETWPARNSPEGRPIVSDVDSESYRVSEYIDYHINPLSTLHPAYLKNTYDFIGKIRNKIIDKDWLIVTGDVSSLYTNMNINRTVACVRKALKLHPVKGRADKHLIELLDLTLRNNDFEFNGEFYLQTCGTAMGKKYAPALANLYLLDFDDQAMNKFRIKPHFYFRYLDDIFFIWPGTVDELKEFESFLNDVTAGIKIKLEHSNTETNFLDTTIYKATHDGDTTLQTKVFFKPTDTHQLLHTASFHPKHTTRGILKSQLIRFKRISSSKKDYDTTCKILFKTLAHRGYTWTMMNREMKNIWFNYADVAGTVKQDEAMIPIIVDYNNLGKKLADGYKRILKKDAFFNNFKLITAYKNPRNLYQSLIRSKLL